MLLSAGGCQVLIRVCVHFAFYLSFLLRVRVRRRFALDYDLEGDLLWIMLGIVFGVFKGKQAQKYKAFSRYVSFIAFFVSLLAVSIMRREFTDLTDKRLLIDHDWGFDRQLDAS